MLLLQQHNTICHNIEPLAWLGVLELVRTKGWELCIVTPWALLSPLELLGPFTPAGLA